MPTAAFTHLVFVDFENIPDIDLAPLDGHRVVVTLFLGKKSKLKADLVEQITRLPFEVRMIKIGESRKNALDFALTFHLGQAVARNPVAQFHIVSGDKRDFDSVVHHLEANHVSVERVGAIGDLSFLPPPKSSAPIETVAPAKAAPAIKKPAVDKTAKVIARLMDPSTGNRPTTKQKLLARIKNDLGKDATDRDAEDVVRKMEKSGLVIASDGKLTYPQR